MSILRLAFAFGAIIDAVALLPMLVPVFAKLLWGIRGVLFRPRLSCLIDAGLQKKKGLDSSVGLGVSGSSGKTSCCPSDCMTQYVHWDLSENKHSVDFTTKRHVRFCSSI
jgi:hypothetical protein